MDSSVSMSIKVPYRSKRMPFIAIASLPQCFSGFIQQLPAVCIGNPRISRDAQKRHAHVKRNALGDGAEGPVPVREVAGVLPEEVADKGFRHPFVARVLHEEVL